MGLHLRLHPPALGMCPVEAYSLVLLGYCTLVFVCVPTFIFFNSFPHGISVWDLPTHKFFLWFSSLPISRHVLHVFAYI